MVLLPQFERLATLIPLRIIVCDDASRDGTRAVIASHRGDLQIEVLVHKINRGLGETVRDLFERVAERCRPEDVIVRMDCDDTHDPAIILSMLDKLSAGYDVAVASRFQPGGGQIGVTPFRSALSRAANLFMKALFPIPGVQEYSCGYRAYRASLIRTALATYGNDFIQLKGIGFTCTLEKLVKLRMLGARFGEVPFVLRYDRKLGPSKMVANITTLGYMIMAIMYYWPWNGWRNHYKHLNQQRAYQPAAEPVPKSESCV